MKIESHNERNDSIYDFKITNVNIDNVDYNVVVTAKIINSLIKKIMHITIENDIPVEFEEINDLLQAKILNLLADYIDENFI